MLHEIENELLRLRVEDFCVEAMQDHVKITIAGRSCVVVAEGFLAMLKQLPDSAGTVSVTIALEECASHADAWATG